MTKHCLLPIFTLCTALVASTLPAQDTAVKDNRVVIAEKELRVGPVKRGMTLAALKKAVPAGEMSITKVPGPEGSELSAVQLWKGTGRELEVIYDDEGQGKELMEVRIIGKDWQLPGGLKHGMSIEQVEKINGKPFKVFGFQWDYAGYANFEDGGKLQGSIGIRFDPGVETDASLAGDQLIPSTNKKLRASKVKVTEITVHLMEQD